MIFSSEVRGVGVIELSQPEGVNSEMRVPKIKVGVNWQEAKKD
jgi:hypothetical protein